MLNSLHSKYLKYGAILGIIPFMTPSGKEKCNLRQTFQHHHLHYHYQHSHLQQLHHRVYRYRYKGNDYTHNRRLRWQQIYTVTLIVANLIATLYGVTLLPFEKSFFISSLVSLIVFVVQTIAVISILLETMFTYGKYYELLNNYNKVETLMKHLLQIQLCKAKIRKRQWLKYTFFILALYGSLITSALVILMKTYFGYFWFALIAILTLRSRSIQMSFYLDYIVYYLELFNVKLNALISCKIDKNYHILDIDYEHLKSFEYLQNLKRIYMEIYGLHDKYNKLFGHSLAVIYTAVVLDIIINMYWTFLTLSEYYESYYNYITLSTLLPLFFILFTMCYTADQCEKQCKLTLISLKRLLTTAVSNSTTAAESYNSVLQSFILQIVQNPITITANGYFVVNLKSLMKILANTAAYLVILLQFRKTSVYEELHPKGPESGTYYDEVALRNYSMYI